MRKYLMAAAALAGLLAAPADAALVLTPQGVTDGFTLSTYYSEPGAYYGLLGVTTMTNGQVIAASYNYDQLYTFNDTDGQTHASFLNSKSLSGIGSGYSVATAGGNTYFSPGFGGTYYKVDPATLALTALTLSSPVTPYLGLWGNHATGHLLSSSYSGLVDINPITGAVHVVTTTTGFDGVTISPDGKTAYGELGGNIYAYDIATGTLLHTYSGNGHSPDGTGVVAGGALDGDIVVSNNDGTIGLIDHATGVESIIADMGGRGDFVGPDWTNGTLFLALAEGVYRLGLKGGSIGGGGGGNPGVPEPLTLSLFAAGLAGTFLRRRKKPA